MVNLWQVDLREDNLEDGLVFIDEWDGTATPFPTNFFQSALGPDCKIYIQPSSSAKTMHVIHHPNEKGTQCDFVQNGIELPDWNSGTFPNFPRFRVDEEEKCDSTISLVNGIEVYWRHDLSIYPNPALEYVTIDMPSDVVGTILISNIHGKMEIYKENVSKKEVVDVSGIPAGVYSVELLPYNNKDKVIYTSRLVITKR